MKGKYTLRMESQEVRNAGGEGIATKAGEWHWVESGDWGPWATDNYIDGKKMPKDVVTFDTRADAETFAEKWSQPQNDFKPTGAYEVIPIKPRMVQDGWEPDGDISERPVPGRIQRRRDHGPWCGEGDIFKICNQCFSEFNEWKKGGE